LWAFNDEALVRAIYASRIPVVSAVGHETDFTLSDFAADLRAPTPSAAAELTAPDLSKLPDMLDGFMHEMRRNAERSLEARKRRLEAAERLIEALSPQKTLNRGYAAVLGTGGKALKDTADVNINDEIYIKLARGELTAVIKEKK
jgi:exodeoxyribonuclease VII large subunit